MVTRSFRWRRGILYGEMSAPACCRLQPPVKRGQSISPQAAILQAAARREITVVAGGCGGSAQRGPHIDGGSDVLAACILIISFIADQVRYIRSAKCTRTKLATKIVDRNRHRHLTTSPLSNDALNPHPPICVRMDIVVED